MPRTKKLNSLKQIDGKLRKEENDDAPVEYEINSLSQLLGDKGLDKYGTHDEEEYRAKLLEMNNSDLQRHAVEVAHVVPDLRPERTIKRCLLEFQKHVSSYKTRKYVRKSESPASKELLKIMAETK